MELAGKFRYNINGYIDGKNSYITYIKGIDRKALEWAETR